MKATLKYTLFFLFACNVCLTKAQTNQATIIFDYQTPIPGIPIGNHIARDKIEATNVSTAQVTAGNSILLAIDKNIQSSASYLDVSWSNGISHNLSTTVNTNLPFGTTDGTPGVSSIGSATYTVPIIVAPGTNNMTPQIAVSYNSGAKDGILGRGWNLNAVSSISLESKNIYNDGVKKGIQLDGSDNISKDGNRLILCPDGYYKTEVEDFTRTFASGPIGVVGTSFIVETKEGTKMHYGQSSNSRLNVNAPTAAATARTLVWYLDKVTDKHGNSINYIYERVQNEVFLKEIAYTENYNLDPHQEAYNFVRFYYDKRSDASTSYILGNPIQKTLIIREIESFCENKSFKRFKFNYLFDAQSYLREIIEYGADNSQLNSTEFKYGDDTPLPNSFRNDRVGSFVPMGTNSDFIIGDYNGDGKSDILTFYYAQMFSNLQKDYISSSNLFLNNSNGGSYSQTINPFSPGLTSVSGTFNPYTQSDYSSEYNPSPTGLSSFDFDGDGMDDVLIGNPISGGTMFTVYYSNGTGFVAGNHFWISGLEKFFIADLTGDGLPEGLAYNSNYNFFKIFLINKRALNNTPQITEILCDALPGTIQFPSLSYSGFTVVDFDGDGIQEVLSAKNNYNFILRFDDPTPTPNVLPINQPQKHFKEIYNEVNASAYFQPFLCDQNGDGVEDVNPGAYFQNYYGDFNGDGITDNIRIGDWTTINTSPKKGAQLNIRYGTGKAFTSFQQLITTNSWSNDKYMVMDVNNDGKSDFLDISKVAGGIYFSVYYNGSLDAVNLLPEIPIPNGVTFPDVIDYVNNSCLLPYVVDPGATTVDPNTIPDFTTGDFDGDGHPEVLFKFNLSGQRMINWFNKSNSQNLLTSTTNGLRVQTDFHYSTLANGGPSVYAAGAVMDYPVINYQGAMPIVNKMTRPNGIGGTTSMLYKYEDAKIHNLGKGFLGFGKVTTTNSTTLVRKEDVFAFDSPTPFYFERSLKNTSTFLMPANLLGTGTPLSFESFTTLYSNDPSLNANLKRHVTYLDNKESTDLILNNSVYEKYEYEPRYCTVIHSLKKINTDLEITETTSVIEPSHSTNGGWFEWKPVESTTTVTLISELPYTRKISNTYDPIYGDLTEFIADPLLPNEVVTSYNYDANTGVQLTKTVSAPLSTSPAPLPVKTTLFSYDDKYRFVTKTSFPGLNQSMEAIYEPKFGGIVLQKGAHGLITQVKYDGFGRKTQVLYPENTITNYTYKWVLPGEIINGTDPLDVSNSLYSVTTETTQKPLSKIYYDLLGRERKTELDGYTQSSGSTNKIYAVKQYDSRGHLYKESGSYNDATFQAHDYLINTYLYGTTAYDLNKLTNSTSTDGVVLKITTTNYVPAINNWLVSTQTDSKSFEKLYNPLGQLTRSTDAGGDIIYKYYSDGNLKSNKLMSSGMETSMKYDIYGRQTELDEKNSGIISYTYNAYGLLESQTDAKGQTYSMVYDELDRLKIKFAPEGQTIYSYVVNGNGINMLKSITTPQDGAFPGPSEEYTYDQFGHVIKKDEIIKGRLFSSQCEYDLFGRLSKFIYPSGFAVNYGYNNSGYETIITRGDNNATIWQANEVNAQGQFTKFTLGNGITTEKTYSNFGVIEDINAPSIFHQHYTFDEYTGNLMQRKDVINNLTEDFEYADVGLDRLTKSTVFGEAPIELHYEPNGNIRDKSNVGTYYYGNKPNAILNIASIMNLPNPLDQVISYTSFNKVKEIWEGKHLKYTYGPHEVRKHLELFDEDDVLLSNRFYLDAYEETSEGNNTAKLHYILTPSGLAAIVSSENNNSPQVNYVYSDYLGSILKLKNNAGVTVAENNYDAWGNDRNSDTWNYQNMSSINPFWLNRGFTGHEHLKDFNLINMNGRIYDPVIGSMLSPDNNVQNATSTQNLNRYSYVMNNPLKYTDPSGDNWVNAVKIVLSIISVPARVMNGGVDYINDKINHQTAPKYGYFPKGYLLWGYNPNPSPLLDSRMFPGGHYGGMYSEVFMNGSPHYTETYYRVHDGLTGKHEDFKTLANAKDKVRELDKRNEFLVNMINLNLIYAKNPQHEITNNALASLGGGPSYFALTSQYSDLSDSKKYPGINIYQNNDKNDFNAVTLPGVGIYLGGGLSGTDQTKTIQHEYGHYLDYLSLNSVGTGLISFYLCIGMPSIVNGALTYIPGLGITHSDFWTEIRANKLAESYFGKSYIKDPVNYPTK